MERRADYEIVLFAILLLVGGYVAILFQEIFVLLLAAGFLWASYKIFFVVLRLVWAGCGRECLRNISHTLPAAPKSTRPSVVWQFGWFILVAYLSTGLLSTFYLFLPQSRRVDIFRIGCFSPPRCALADVGPDTALAQFAVSARDWQGRCYWELKPPGRISIAGIPLRVTDEEVRFGRYGLADGAVTRGCSFLVPLNPWLLTVRTFEARLDRECWVGDDAVPLFAYVYGTVQTHHFLNPLGPMGVLLALWLRYRVWGKQGLPVVEGGLQRLLARLGRGHPRYKEASTLQAHLRRNVARARRWGDTAARRAERVLILEGLDRLSLEVLGMSFQELLS